MYNQHPTPVLTLQTMLSGSTPTKPCRFTRSWARPHKSQLPGCLLTQLQMIRNKPQDYVTAYEFISHDSTPVMRFQFGKYQFSLSKSALILNMMFTISTTEPKPLRESRRNPVLFGDGPDGPDNILQYAKFTNPGPGYGGEFGIDYTYDLGDIFIAVVMIIKLM